MSLKIIRILQHGLQWYFLNIQKGACFDKSIAIVTQLYNRNLSISDFQDNLTLKSFINKDNDIYSMIIKCPKRDTCLYLGERGERVGLPALPAPAFSIAYSSVTTEVDTW